MNFAVDFAVNFVVDFHDHLNLPRKATADLRNLHRHSLRNSHWDSQLQEEKESHRVRSAGYRAQEIAERQRSRTQDWETDFLPLLVLTDGRVANPPASYRSLSGPPGPKSPKSLKKVSRGLRPRGPRKSGKSLEKVRKV